MRDLLVIGGGPVGLTTALYAAQHGLSVTVRERRAGVLDKACGEGLMPSAVSALADLGVALEGHPIEGIHYLDGAHSAQARFAAGPGLGVRRTTLHAALRQAVEQAGVEVVTAPVRDIVDAADHLVVDGQRCRYAVAADGLHSPVRRMRGLAAPARGPRRYGLRTHLPEAPWSSLVEVHWGPTAEAYVTPVSADLVGVAVLSSDRRPLPELLGQFPLLQRRLAGHRLGEVLGAGPLRQKTRRQVDGRVLLVGDAAGYVDALTGEGIAVGLADARAAVAAVLADDPQQYQRDWGRRRRRHDLLTTTLLGLTRAPLLRQRLVPTAQLLPGVFALAVNQIAGPVSPAEPRRRRPARSAS